MEKTKRSKCFGIHIFNIYKQFLNKVKRLIYSKTIFESPRCAENYNNNVA